MRRICRQRLGRDARRGRTRDAPQGRSRRARETRTPTPEPPASAPSPTNASAAHADAGTTRARRPLPRRAARAQAPPPPACRAAGCGGMATSLLRHLRAVDGPGPAPANRVAGMRLHRPAGRHRLPADGRELAATRLGGPALFLDRGRGRCEPERDDQVSRVTDSRAFCASSAPPTDPSLRPSSTDPAVGIRRPKRSRGGHYAYQLLQGNAFVNGGALGGGSPRRISSRRHLHFQDGKVHDNVAGFPDSSIWRRCGSIRGPAVRDDESSASGGQAFEPFFTGDALFWVEGVRGATAAPRLGTASAGTADFVVRYWRLRRSRSAPGGTATTWSGPSVARGAPTPRARFRRSRS